MIVTLLTDFGTADYYVGAMKGVIVSGNPSAVVVDIAHDIPAHDIEAAAFTLLGYFDTFPSGTVHVAVVDPGVGSARRPIVVDVGDYFFVGPDNGIFGHVYGRYATCHVYHLTSQVYVRPSQGTTFHGRDIFAPAAGALSGGVPAQHFGPRIEDYVRLADQTPQRSAAGVLKGSILHVDRFGNCITNIWRNHHLTDEEAARGVTLRVGGSEVRSFRHFYAEKGGEPGEPFAIWGSLGLLEIAVYRDSAARLLNVGRGEPVTVVSNE